MTDAIADLIRKKPHLADPLRFYQKTLDFIGSVRGLPLSVSPTQTAYAPDIVPQVLDRFSSLIDLPEGTLSPLKQAMELREVDFTRLPLGEVPSFSLPYAEDDLSMLLYLLSKPWFLALSEACRIKSGSWDEGKCPVCNSQPVMTWAGEGGQRHASCSFCGTTGTVSRTGCAVCGSTEASKQNVLVFQGEEGFSINTCDACNAYVKGVDPGMLKSITPELADVASLPLDIVIQEKGYQRKAPNPIGMLKISTHG